MVLAYSFRGLAHYHYDREGRGSMQTEAGAVAESYNLIHTQSENKMESN